jgi:hypothetical protein
LFQEHCDIGFFGDVFLKEGIKFDRADLVDWDDDGSLLWGELGVGGEKFL